MSVDQFVVSRWPGTLLIVFVVSAFCGAILLYQSGIIRNQDTIKNQGVVLLHNQETAHSERQVSVELQEVGLRNQVLIARHDHISGVTMGPKPPSPKPVQTFPNR